MVKGRGGKGKGKQEAEEEGKVNGMGEKGKSVKSDKQTKYRQATAKSLIEDKRSLIRFGRCLIINKPNTCPQLKVSHIFSL